MRRGRPSVRTSDPVHWAIRNRQRAIPFDLEFLRRMAAAAHPLCRAAARQPRQPLASLEKIEVTIIGRQAISRLHRLFFGDPAPTDVITFPEGEILLGAEEVAHNAGIYGHTPDEEAALCLIHGMLHLAGWDDRTARAAKEMARRQEQIFKAGRAVVVSKPR